MFSGGEVAKPQIDFYQWVEGGPQCVQEDQGPVEDAQTACQIQPDGSCYVDLPAQQVSLPQANEAAGCSLFKPRISSNRPEGVTVLHFNDLHGNLEGNDREYFAGGLARMTTAIGRVAEENHERGWRTVVTIAGDVFTGGLDSDGETVIATLKKMQQVLKDKGVQFVAVLGNHAFDHGVETTVKYIEDAGFPVLGANFGYHDPDEQVCRPLAPARATVDLGGGAELAIVGLTTDQKIPSKVTPKKKGPVVVSDPLSMAASEVAAAKEGNPVATIVLTHIGDEDKGALAQAVSGQVDAIVGAHTHDGRPEYCDESYSDCESIGDVPYCRVPAQPTGGSFIGRIDIDFDEGRGNKVISRTLPLRSDTQEDPEVRGFIDRALELDRKLHPENYVVEGYLSSDLEGSRERQSTLGAFTTDAMLRKAKESGHSGASIALINSGAMRDDIIRNAKGQVLSGQVNRVFKYNNQLVTVKVKGSDLQKILEKSEGLPSGDGMYLQHAVVPECIDDDKMYDVVTIDYLVKYDHTYFPEGTKHNPIGVKVREAFIDRLPNVERVAGGRR